MHVLDKLYTLVSMIHTGNVSYICDFVISNKHTINRVSTSLTFIIITSLKV